MRKIIPFVCAVLVIMYAGCANIGEDPYPAPGPNPDGSVTLFVNGSAYNFNWEAKWDGIQIVGYESARPDPDDPKKTINGAQYLEMGSRGVFFAGGEGYIVNIDNNWVSTATTEVAYSKYSSNGLRSMGFLNDLKGNYEGKWRFTLFPNPPLYLNNDDPDASNYNQITFWAKYENEPDAEAGTRGRAGVNLAVWTKSGIPILGTGESSPQFIEIPYEARLTGEWYQYRVPLNPEWAPGVPLPADETLRQWMISVPQNAGKIYVDEIVLVKR
jgi:hypothetical protein